MATDQFGNILSPEEEERLRQHQMRMGVMPAALPSSAPFGGGIGLSNYKGNYGPYEAPAPWSPEPIVPNEPFTIPQLANTTPTWDTGAVSNAAQIISLPDTPVGQPSAPVGAPSWGFTEALGVDPAHFDNVDIIDKLASSGALNTPSTHTDDSYAAALKSSDLVSSGVHPALAGALGLQGLFTANVPSTVGHFAGLVDRPHAGQAIDDSIEQNILGITTPDSTPNDVLDILGNPAYDAVTRPNWDTAAISTAVANPYSSTGKSYWDSHPGAQAALDDAVALEIDDFSEIAPVDLDTHGKYKSDTGWHQGGWKGKSSADYANWQLERLPTFTTMTPTMERVREQEAVAAGNKAAETAGGLDKIARDRLANQAAIEKQMVDDAARIKSEQKAAAKALKDAQNLARKKENARLNAAKREMLQERRQEEAARQAAAQAEANAAIERVAQAQALMSKYGGRREPAENYMSAAERDIVAAAQVDTFAGMPMGLGFMGADIGREDGGGFTGGDFSGGAGWE